MLRFFKPVSFIALSLSVFAACGNQPSLISSSPVQQSAAHQKQVPQDDTLTAFMPDFNPLEDFGIQALTPSYLYRRMRISKFLKRQTSNRIYF